MLPKSPAVPRRPSAPPPSPFAHTPGAPLGALGTAQRARNGRTVRRWRCSRPGLLFDWNADVLVVHMAAPLDARSFGLYAEALDQELQARDPDDRIGVLYDVHREVPMEWQTLRYRKTLADILARHHDKTARTVAGYSFVSMSALARGYATGINWLARPPYPTMTSPELADGYRFIVERLGGRDDEVPALVERHATLVEAHREAHLRGLKTS